MYTKAGSRLEVGGAQRGADEGQLSYRFMVKATLRSVSPVVACGNQYLIARKEQKKVQRFSSTLSQSFEDEGLGSSPSLLGYSSGPPASVPIQLAKNRLKSRLKNHLRCKFDSVACLNYPFWSFPSIGNL